MSNELSKEEIETKISTIKNQLKECYSFTAIDRLKKELNYYQEKLKSRHK